MKEFIDKTTESSGTPLNRATLMAMQGFVASTSEFYVDEDGYPTIKQTNDNGETLTTYRDEDGNYQQVFVGEKTIRKYTIFWSNGTIEERIY